MVFINDVSVTVFWKLNSLNVHDFAKKKEKKNTTVKELLERYEIIDL